MANDREDSKTWGLQPRWLYAPANEPVVARSSAKALVVAPTIAELRSVVAQKELEPIGRMSPKFSVRMTVEELEAIDAARGSASRQDFLRKSALWLADQADKLR